jgi:hypothetical protein
VLEPFEKVLEDIRAMSRLNSHLRNTLALERKLFSKGLSNKNEHLCKSFFLILIATAI